MKTRDVRINKFYTCKAGYVVRVVAEACGFDGKQRGFLAYAEDSPSAFYVAARDLAAETEAPK